MVYVCIFLLNASTLEYVQGDIQGLEVSSEFYTLLENLSCLVTKLGIGTHLSLTSVVQ